MFVEIFYIFHKILNFNVSLKTFVFTFRVKGKENDTKMGKTLSNNNHFHLFIALPFLSLPSRMRGKEMHCQNGKWMWYTESFSWSAGGEKLPLMHPFSSKKGGEWKSRVN